MISISIPAESIPGCIFGSGLVIVAHICDELSRGQYKQYTNRRTDGRDRRTDAGNDNPHRHERPRGNITIPGYPSKIWEWPNGQRWPNVGTTVPMMLYNVGSTHIAVLDLMELLTHALIQVDFCQCKGSIEPSPPGQNGRHFADDSFRRIFMNEKFCILTKSSLKFVPKGPIDNNPTLAWHRIGGKPLSKSMPTRFTV